MRTEHIGLHLCTISLLTPAVLQPCLCIPENLLLAPCLVGFHMFAGHAATIFYDENGAVLRKFEVPVKDPPTSLRIFRDEIGRLLVDEAQRLHPGKISFRVSSPVVAVNLDDQTVRVANASDHNDVKQVMNQHHISRCVALHAPTVGN